MHALNATAPSSCFMLLVLALALKTVTGMCVLEGFYFEHSEDASEEIFRLNRRLGLSDDEIVERIEFIVDREMPGGEAMS